MIRVAIVGGAGRMGQAIAEGLARDVDVDLLALVDPREPPQLFGATWFRDISELTDAVEVVVDFSRLDVARATMTWCLEHHVAGVIGTTGLSTGDLDTLATRVAAHDGRVLVAANFSIGAVLAERFAAMAAAHFDSVEIIELHHDKKVDAPSGTSLATASAVARARAQAGLAAIVDVTEHESAPHPRGAQGPGGVRVHSVRLPGLVAHQEVIFGGPGEGLTIRHDSYDRASFVHGVILAVRSILTRPGLTIGLDELV